MKPNNVYPLKAGLEIADAEFIEALKEFDEEILNIVYSGSNDLIQKMIVSELCRVKGFTLLNNLTA